MASALGPLHKPRSVLESDHYHYLAMARAPFGGDEEARTPPYCFRILTPLLVHGLTRIGLGTNAAFWLVTNLALVGFLLCLHRLLLARGLSLGRALLGVALAGLLPGAVRWYEYQYWMTDPLCLFLMTASLLLVEEGCDGALLPLSLLGVAARESYVLVFPWLLVRWARRDGIASAMASTARVALPSLALLVGIHLFVPSSPAPPLSAVMTDAIGFRWRHLLDNQLYLVTIGAFGVLVPLLLSSPARVAASLRERPEDALLVAGAYASLLLGVNTDRLLAYALPAVLPLALATLDAVRIPVSLAAGGLVAAQLAFYLLTPFHGVQGLSLYQPLSWAVGRRDGRGLAGALCHEESSELGCSACGSPRSCITSTTSRLCARRTTSASKASARGSGEITSARVSRIPVPAGLQSRIELDRLLEVLLGERVHPEVLQSHAYHPVKQRIRRGGSGRLAVR